MSIAQLQLLVRNKQPHEIQAGVRYATLESAVAEFKRITDAATSRHVCASCGEVSTFEIQVQRCDATPYRIMEVEAVERMKSLYSETTGAAS